MPPEGALEDLVHTLQGLLHGQSRYCSYGKCMLEISLKMRTNGWTLLEMLQSSRL